MSKTRQAAPPEKVRGKKIPESKKDTDIIDVSEVIYFCKEYTK